MRTWIALATYSENGDREGRIGDLNTLDRVVVFTSGDGEKPMDGDLAQALDGYKFDEAQELILVPLDAGHTITVRAKTTLDILSRGNVVA